MKINKEDLDFLKNGEPPENKEFIETITEGKNIWLEPFYEYYLNNFIPKGGSKVKVLIGNEGTGKTHLLKSIKYEAEELGYNVIYFSAKDIEWKINDIVSFYKVIVRHIDTEKLISGLAKKVGQKMGYENRYDGKSKMLPLVIEDGYNANDAAKEIRDGVYRAFKDSDLSASFFTFALEVTRDRLLDDNKKSTNIALKWLIGEKLDTGEKYTTSLFERLQKSNARYWINSLINLLDFAGIKGLIVLIDDMGVLAKKFPDSNKYIYTPNAIKDTYELIRQIIDDAELLNKFLLVIAGDRVLIDDDKRGFKNYEALWMRLQTGLVPSKKFNSFADIVDVDKHLKLLGEDFPKILSKKILTILEESGYKRNGDIMIPQLNDYSPLKSAVIECGLRAEREEIN
ncbi:MAG: BREX system ATP-binding domain-containing protein [Candidatus Humimicrobiaceae bacterium]